MRPVDYDREQYQDYARGRALTKQQLQTWVSAFAAVLPERRPLVGLDVGSGTGRYTPALARAFGPVTGVEPSCQMREIAQAQSQPAGVRYLAGSAEDLPVSSGSADFALMFCSWHHVQDKPRAARELARVLKPNGRLLLRANSSDHIPGPGGWSTSPAGTRPTPRCSSRCTRSSRRSRRSAGASRASARSPNHPPVPGPTCCNGCVYARCRSLLSSIPTSWRPASAASSRLLAQTPTHQRPCSLSRCSRSSGRASHERQRGPGAHGTPVRR